MDYKNKYNDALERARKEYKTHESFNGFREMLLHIFPELKESDDEEIRKSIIGFLITISSLKDGMTVSNEDFDSKVILEWVDWLEDQGKKDKLIQELGEYKVKYTQEVLEKHIDNMSNKDDDRIRKAIIHFISEQDGFLTSINGINVKDAIAWLEKQESVEEIVKRCKTSWFNSGKIQGKMEGLSDDEKYQQGWHDALEKQGEQKSAWSEEDERIYQSIMDDTVQEYQLDDRQTEWLSNIKYRYFPKSKQKWNEEDEKMYNIVHDLAWEAYKTSRRLDIPTFGTIGDWLRSLKDRIQSKQSNKPQGKTALEAIKEENTNNPYDHENTNTV